LRAQGCFELFERAGLLRGRARYHQATNCGKAFSQGTMMWEGVVRHRFEMSAADAFTESISCIKAYREHATDHAMNAVTYDARVYWETVVQSWDCEMNRLLVVETERIVRDDTCDSMMFGQLSI
jgi:hypothetical protein